MWIINTVQFLYFYRYEEGIYFERNFAGAQIKLVVINSTGVHDSVFETQPYSYDFQKGISKGREM